MANQVQEILPVLHELLRILLQGPELHHRNKQNVLEKEIEPINDNKNEPIMSNTHLTVSKLMSITGEDFVFLSRTKVRMVISVGNLPMWMTIIVSDNICTQERQYAFGCTHLPREKRNQQTWVQDPSYYSIHTLRKGIVAALLHGCYDINKWLHIARRKGWGSKLIAPRFTIANPTIYVYFAHLPFRDRIVTSFVCHNPRSSAMHRLPIPINTPE